MLKSIHHHIEHTNQKKNLLHLRRVHSTKTQKIHCDKGPQSSLSIFDVSVEPISVSLQIFWIWMRLEPVRASMLCKYGCGQGRQRHSDSRGSGHEPPKIQYKNWLFIKLVSQSIYIYRQYDRMEEEFWCQDYVMDYSILFDQGPM